MSGHIIARTLLTAHAGTIALVPATNIVSGVIPQAVTAPCIGITSVSSTDRNTLAAGTVIKVTERVQITVIGETYTKCKAVMTQVRKACRNKSGTVGSFTGITCRLDGKGPDFDNEAGLAMQSQDLLITFDENAS